MNEKWVGLVNILCMTMYDISKIRPQSILGPWSTWVSDIFFYELQQSLSKWEMVSHGKCLLSLANNLLRHNKGPLILLFNTLRPRKNGRRFADNTFKRIFLNENVWISLKISLKFVPKGSIINIPALVQIMAWRHSGDKPLSEPMMVSLPTHICVTRPQWVNRDYFKDLDEFLEKKIKLYCARPRLFQAT